MAGSSAYDFDDELIRDMVKGSHCPTEEVSRDTNNVIVVIKCSKDQSPWPCEAIAGLRDWWAANEAAG